MKLKSVSGPTKEAAKAPARSRIETITTSPSQDAVATAAAARKRLVSGKRAEPLIPRGSLVTTETVIGVDERTRVLDTEPAPWRMICSLTINAPFGMFIGTGWFAGPKTIITAGHCVFDDEQMGGWAESILVIPGRDETDEPFGRITAKRFSTVDRWLINRDPDFDIAAIHLDEPKGDNTGWFGTASFPDAELKDFMVNVAGYPGDRGNGEQLWWARNRIRAVTQRRIFYDVDTFGGQSGGPAFVLQTPTAAPTVVGIHAYGTGGTPSSIPMEVNSAPRIIPEIVDQIAAWIAADGGTGTGTAKTAAYGTHTPKSASRVSGRKTG